jgi:hypothetical protein
MYQNAVPLPKIMVPENRLANDAALLAEEVRKIVIWVGTNGLYAST